MHPTRLIAMGGFREIGKSTLVIEHHDEIIIVDAGIKFLDLATTGLRGVIPQYDYLVKNAQKIKAIFITHGHEDHLGGIPFLLEQLPVVPTIYAPVMAVEHLKLKLKEIFGSKLPRKLHGIQSGNVYLFKHFRVDFWTLQHSIPDAFGIRVRTKHGTILCTGDFRIDYTPIGNYTDFEKLQRFGREGVTVLFSDSTNAMRPNHSPSESIILKNIERIIANAEKRTIITAFSSNLTRVLAIIELCERLGKKVMIFGRSMVNWVTVGTKLKMAKIKKSTLVDVKDVAKYSPKDLVIITTGSQGEEMAALTRMAKRAHTKITLKHGDTIIFSSSPIPGNRLRIETLVNALMKCGAIIKENHERELLHTSGHAHTDELFKVLSITKPKYFLPYHGFYRMLRDHARIAVAAGVSRENILALDLGRVVELYKGELRVTKKLPALVDFVDGNYLHKMNKTIFIERAQMGANGVVFINILISRILNRLLEPPKIYVFGVAEDRDIWLVFARLKRIITRSVNNILKTSNKWTKNTIKVFLRTEITNMLYEFWHREPMISTNVFIFEDSSRNLEQQVERFRLEKIDKRTIS